MGEFVEDRLRSPSPLPSPAGRGRAEEGLVLGDDGAVASEGEFPETEVIAEREALGLPTDRCDLKSVCLHIRFLSSGR